MNPYKLTFKLKQHTPIIHFRYDQTGATLRATELKPKLDKFVLFSQVDIFQKVQIKNKYKQLSFLNFIL